MQSSEIPTEFWKALPGVLGSFFATLFFREPSWTRHVGMFLAGAVFARYGSSWVATHAGLDEGFAGFLMGLFGMAVVQKAFDFWQPFDFGPIVVEWSRKALRLPPLPPKEAK